MHALTGTGNTGRVGQAAYEVVCAAAIEGVTEEVEQDGFPARAHSATTPQESCSLSQESR